ncbi:glycoside hydrolase superfamily [Aspergillus ambiguus]|uniref:putative extracellular endoglucanase/cellulase n=1 Tax=Aspergillus ambiguus TaxID=176160 RepID=UPI003CCCB0A2
MRIGSLMMAASAAGLVHAYPRREMKKRETGFTWFGVNESGAEFGEGNIPGTLGTDYTWPDTSKIQTLRSAGMNIFRVPFLMERLVPDDMTGTPDSTYLQALKKTVTAITDSGAYAVLDPHNYGRYSGSIISSTSDFKAFWKTVAGEFASNEKVIFDTNNEYHDMEQSLVLDLNQAAINGIRAAGAKTQYIFVEGNSYTGAWKWASTNDNLAQLTDSADDKLIYEMHQYLDSDGSGTSETCVSSTIGKERMQSATQWLKNNNKKGFLGEFAGGANQQCETAVEGMLEYMSQNSDVWMGAEWWAAGPWWGDYMYSLEPTDGAAYDAYMPILKKYFVGSAGASSVSTSTPSSTSASASASSSSSTSASAAATSVETSATATAVPVSSVTSSSSADSATTTQAKTTETPVVSTTTYPTSVITSVTSILPIFTSPPSTSNPPDVASRWGQCGGINWNGPKVCQTGYTCVMQNPYFHQCM